MSKSTYQIKGMDKLLRNCDPSLYSDGLREFMRDAGKLALAEAAKRQPKPLSGKLSGSLHEGGAGNILEIDPSTPPRFAKVGTDVNNSGFRYPWAMEASGKYHFRGRKGATYGWFSKGIKAGIRDVKKLIKGLQDEINKKWQR